MLVRLAQFTVRRSKAVLIASVVFFALAGFIGGGVAQHLSSGGFEDPGAESTRALQVIEDVFHAGGPNVVLLVTAQAGTVDDPAAVSDGQALTAELAAEPGIEQAFSYWTLGNPPPLRSNDNRQALVLARIAGDEDAVDARIETLSPAFTRQTGALDVRVGGQAEVFRQIGSTVESDLAKAESVAIPITLLLLVVVFGSVIAAGLPVGVGVLSIIATFLVLRVIAELTQVSIFALNLTTAMGLGLAIDYSLFVVSRFREELHNGLEPGPAVVRTVNTAGRTVVFSAATVAASLAAMLVFPIAFLRSFAYAGIAVVALAALISVVVLPAALAKTGRRIDKWSVFKRKPQEIGEGFWHRLAMTVMRRPVLLGGSVVALLIVLGLPFLHIQLGLPDDRVLPTGASSRQVQDEIRTNFTSNEAGTVQVVAAGSGNPAGRTAEIGAFAQDLSRLEGASRVDALTGSYIGGALVAPPNAASARFATADGTWLSVVPAVEPLSAAGEELVEDVRALDSPFPVEVAGPSAALVDSKAAILGRIPLAAGIIAVITFVVLFLMFGSVLVPLKAIVLNLLSLTATFGAMVWIFQDGHLSGLLDFTATGDISISTPILMFCIAFGLSMDYEVFLLSRIKEEHDRTGDNQQAVAVGLERTGRIVTAAAALLAIVFIAMATSSVSFIKLFGIGLTMAVLMDATLIRAVLVPAFMRLAGEANWWAPAPMRRIYERWGFSDADPEPAQPPRAGAGPIATAPASAPTPTPAGGRRTRAPRGEGERLRDEILSATEKLLLKTGDESAVSIRAIADSVGVSPPSIYLHFADKDDLIYSVCALQFGKLDVVVAETTAGVDDPLEKLRRRGQAYVRFGVGHPEHYRIMLMGKSHVSRDDFEAGLLPGMRSFQALIENVGECIAAAVFAEDDPFRVATILWAAVHGMTSLLISVPGFPTFQDPEALVDQMLDTLARGLAPRV